VGWQLDPFGHSATQASLMTSKVGFDALYFGRIDYQDLQLRKLQKGCEGLWDSSKNLNNTTVFWGLTGSFNGNYGSPSGYCFDIGCGKDVKDLTKMNRIQLVDTIYDFLRKIRVQSDEAQGNHIMLTMGSDFQVRSVFIVYFYCSSVADIIYYYYLVPTGPFQFCQHRRSNQLNKRISSLEND
jgi:hypothetical protein